MIGSGFSDGKNVTSQSSRRGEKIHDLWSLFIHSAISLWCFNFTASRSQLCCVVLSYTEEELVERKKGWRHTIQRKGEKLCEAANISARTQRWSGLVCGSDTARINSQLTLLNFMFPALLCSLLTSHLVFPQTFLLYLSNKKKCLYGCCGSDFFVYSEK